MAPDYYACFISILVLGFVLLLGFSVVTFDPKTKR